VGEVVELLAPKDGELVVDLTLGEGGHSEAILKKAQVKLIGVDLDRASLKRAKERLARYASRSAFVEGNFKDLDSILKRSGVEGVDKILFDLGWNTLQLQSGRGFSFMHNEPLIMSFGEEPASGFSARDILNTWTEQGLADLLYGYGEERYARKIAKAVVARRKVAPIESTIELLEIVRDATPSSYHRGKIHFATRTFQALRIAVNDELGSLQKALHAAWKLLSPGGRMVVITFHSIEDRLVKKTFLSFAKKDGRLLVKKPIVPSHEEIKKNPRARSAKLRGIEKN
jgi:16S rRNA (cytosine1402-N4)-methyltransferase